MYKSLDKWLPGYLASIARRSGRACGTRHLLFCVADHFEPFRAGASRNAALTRVRKWVAEYPSAFEGFTDADGRNPRHTFFYPQEEYDAECLDLLSGLCGKGLGEVEIHLHHRNDTAEGLRTKLVSFRDILRRQHGLLGAWERGSVERRATTAAFSLQPSAHSLQFSLSALDPSVSAIRNPQSAIPHQPFTIHHSPSPAYGFVHGNWTLCNSAPNGDWCGVNEELGILSNTGCYADFTFPSAPSPTQTRMVNAIYYASDAAGRPRGHDRGRRLAVGLNPGQRMAACETKRESEAGIQEVSGFGVQCSEHESANTEHRTLNTRHQPSTINHSPSTIPPPPSLLLITGPLGLDWRHRKWGLLPRLENGSISGSNLPSPDRVDLWVRQHIHVIGRPEWVFVKVHSHGCVEANMDGLLGGSAGRMHEYLRARYNDGRRWKVHYVTAREMYNIARAAEDGMTGDPGGYRDYEISPPPVGGMVDG